MQNVLGQQAARMYKYEMDAQGNPVLDEAGMPKITGFQPYEGYETDTRSRVAGPTTLQTGTYEAAKNLGYDPRTLAASTGIEALAKKAGDTAYSTSSYGNQFNAPQAYQTGQFTPSQVSAPSLQQYQMGPAERIGTDSFNQAGTAQNYMSPYMQNVVDIQQREARRASDIAGQQQAAQAVGRGAFGGSRDAIMRAERERNLGMQLGDIQATGQQAAFQNAQQQFNAEQARQLQAQQANQQAGLTSSIQNLNALLGIQQLGSGQTMQSQLANQQYGMTAQQLAEQSRQFGAGQGMTAAQLAAQYGLSADQLNEQSRQYGAGLGLQGLQTGLSGYGQLSNVGQNLYGQNIGNLTLQNQFGTQQQQGNQNVETAKYQDWLSKQNYPQQQLDTMASYIRGTPVSTTSASQYTAAPSNISQIAGIGLTGSAIYNNLNPAQPVPRKKGGSIKENKPRGLEALALSKLG